MEHHSNIVPWEITAKIRDFKIKYANVTSDGVLDVKDFENKITPKTKIACISQVSNVTGVVNDIKYLSKIAHDHGALFLVDGAQSVPHMKVDVQDLDADFLAFSGHKMLAPTGIGVLYAKKALLQQMGPFQGGGEMIKEVAFNSEKQQCDISWNELPWKFEAGTPNIAGAIGLAAAIKYLEQVGIDNILAHEKTLTEYAVKGMKCLNKISLHGPTDSSKCGIIPFSVAGLTSMTFALLCDSYGIAIRSGLPLCTTSSPRFSNCNQAHEQAFTFTTLRKKLTVSLKC
jgi:cysteine desulfurase/selenocysteine lyase